MGLQNFIRQRTQSEWQQFFFEKWTSVRIFVQENGEKACLVTFIASILVVVFFKLFILLLSLALLAYLVVMVVSDSDRDSGQASSH